MKRLKEGFSGERTVVLPPAIIQEMEKDPVGRYLHITDIGYFPNARHHYRERSKPISQYILIYCINGAGWVEFNGKKHEILPNHFIILPANNERHRYGSDERIPWTIYWIHFKGELAEHLAQSLDKPINIKPGNTSRIGDRHQLFEEIMLTLEMGYSKDNLLFSSTLLHHYLGSLKYLPQYRNAKKEQIGEDDYIASVIHYMKENIDKKLTLEQMARYIGYSPSHFSALFSKETGHSPTNYFNQLKIQQACQYLDLTDMKINQICYKIGIDDCYYFSRLFTKIMGISPTRYKSQKKG